MIVTASPVLTNEIRRFYTGLKNKVIGELRKREERKRERETTEAVVEEEGKIGEAEMDMIQEQVAAEKIEELEEPTEDTINEDELMDMEEMEKNMKLPQSMQEMRNDDFPAFLTIKRLVYMIDGSLRRPFFARNLKNEIIGLDSQAEWHNE